MPTFSFSYDHYANLDSLTSKQNELITAAIEMTNQSHAPYSNFHVGCAVLLANQKIITGSNIENSSYPVGICAERTALANVISNHRNAKIKSIAISYQSESKQNKIIFPCGMCRQFILECEQINQVPIELILHAPSDETVILSKASDLLPFGFTNVSL